MSGRIFLDTNVLVYAVDTADAEKQRRAQSILEGSAAEYPSPTFVISTQVLQEFCVTVTRKLKKPMTGAEAEEGVTQMMRLSLIQVDGELILKAIHAHRNHSLSFWDGLIVAAALRAGCPLLLSEDLRHGQTLQGMTVENPFRSGL